MTLFLATRPAFLSITAVAVLVGLAHALHGGAQPPAGALALALLGALLAHAGANVLNDVYDAANGSDARNADRVAPFTGGSRFIQDGTLTAASMRRLAWSLLGAAATTGLALLLLTDGRLAWYGLAGLGLAIAYSAPPLMLMARGLGEPAVGAAWSLVVAGTDFVARGGFAPAVLWVAVPFGLQVTLILLVNQVPDFKADAAVGKRNWVVRLGRDRASTLYRVGLCGAYGTAGIGIVSGQQPWAAAACFLILPAQWLADRALARHHAAPAKLRQPIVLTLAAAHLFGIALALGLLADRFSRTT